jgi:RNA polymerase sigma-70 factor (ECF subfamily)
MLQTDEELMGQTKQGDLAAFGVLFDRYQPRLVAFLTRFCGDHGTAEDLAQDAFWRIWEGRGSYDTGRRFDTWLFVVAKNAALNQIRQATRHRSVPIDSLAEGEWASSMPDAIQIDRRDAVRAALQQLPTDQRLILILREYEGLSHREVAEVMGCSEGAARALAHRARAVLREHLRPLLLEHEDRCHAR